MNRREFITLLGGAAAAWPLSARAQQQAIPVIGFLDSRLPDTLADRLRGFRLGLKLAGYAEGENVAVVYRFAENQAERLPALAVELVRLPVAVIVASGGPNVAFASKAATTTIPIVFLHGEDPVRSGLVASLARPSGNLTGINFVNRELAAKQLALLRELVPAATRCAVLVNPATVPRTSRCALRHRRHFLRLSAHPTGQSGVAPRASSGVRGPHCDRSWRADELRNRLKGSLASRRRLCRPHPQRCETGRLAGNAIDQDRADYQR